MTYKLQFKILDFATWLRAVVALTACALPLATFAIEAAAQAPKPPAAAPRTPETSKSQAESDASKSAPQAAAWSAVCTSPSRQGELDCGMEQIVTMRQTGQLVTKMTVRVPASTRAPVTLIQVPVGLYLPAGIILQVDGRKPQTFPVQTCDLNGCYAGSQIQKELLDQLLSGQQLTVTFEDAAQKKITVPLSLANFAEAYNRIK